MSYKISLLLIVIFFAFSCKETVKEENNGQLSSLEQAVSDNPNGENISKLLVAYNKTIQDADVNRKTLKETLDKAYDLTDNQGWTKEQIGFITTYLKEFPADKMNENKIIQLIRVMKERQQSTTSKALEYSFVEAFPSSEFTDSLKKVLPGAYADVDAYLKDLAEKIFVNPDESGINSASSREYVNACEAMALVLPAKSSTPRYLFNAAEMSRTMRTFDKTLYLYDWVIDKYPSYEKAPMTLFMKGFILENEMNNTELAKVIYREFLEKYPSHDLADDVQFLYDNIGKSNEEILKIIEEKKAAK